MCLKKPDRLKSVRKGTEKSQKLTHEKLGRQPGGKIAHLVSQLIKGLGSLCPQGFAGFGKDVAGAFLGFAHQHLLFNRACGAAFFTGQTGVLTGAGQFGLVVGKAFRSLVLERLGLFGHAVHDAVALLYDIADGADKEDV